MTRIEQAARNAATPYGIRATRDGFHLTEYRAPILGPLDRDTALDAYTNCRDIWLRGQP